MSKPKLTNEDFCRASKRLKCQVAAIKAVAQVESAGNGFLPDGRVIILFERHHFAKHTGNKFNKDYPQISNRTSGGYYGKEKEYQRFNAAFALNPDAAMKSCSWGKFQILGSNHEVCGFPTVGKFVDAMKDSEGRQLDAFCGFVDGNHLTGKLRNLDWAGFARGYNGSAYKKNSYDTKMATAYRKFAKENIDCNSHSAAAPTVDLPVKLSEQLSASSANQAAADAPLVDAPTTLTEVKTTETTDTLTTEVTATAGDVAGAPATKISQNGPLAKWLFSSGALGTVGTAAWGFITGNLNVIGIGIICLTLLIIVLIFRGAITDAIRMQTASDPSKYNVS